MIITSFRHDQARTQKRRQIIAAVIILALTLFLARGPLSGPLGGVLQVLGRHFWSLKLSAEEHIGGLLGLLHSKSALLEENNALRASLDLVAVEGYSRERLRAENEELKTKLGRSPESTFTVARVLTAPPVSPYDTLVIDAGTDHGVASGMEVFADGDFKIGFVSRVFARSAVVTLYSTPDTELPVSIGTSSIQSTAHGVGGGNFLVILPKGTPVSKGDIVEIPALAPAYAGVVGGIEKPAGTSLQTIFIKLPFNLFALKWVYLARPQNDHANRTP